MSLVIISSKYVRRSSFLLLLKTTSGKPPNVIYSEHNLFISTLLFTISSLFLMLIPLNSKNSSKLRGKTVTSRCLPVSKPQARLLIAVSCYLKLLFWPFLVHGSFLPTFPILSLYVSRPLIREASLQDLSALDRLHKLYLEALGKAP